MHLCYNVENWRKVVWTTIKLRNFYYINKKLLEDYIAAIEGYTYKEEIQKVNETSQKTAGAKAGVLGVTGDGKYEKQSSEEKKRKVRISDAAKFEKLFTYLSDSEDEPLPYYDFLHGIPPRITPGWVVDGKLFAAIEGVFVNHGNADGDGHIPAWAGVLGQNVVLNDKILMILHRYVSSEK